MKNDSFLVHLLLAAILSLGISSAVWLLLDVFHPLGFMLASIGAAFLGALAGWAGGKYLVTTLSATLLLRGAILFFAVGG